MKMTPLILGVLGAGLWLLTIPGCETDSRGVKDTVGAYSALVDASPDKVTDAARKAVEEMKLMDVTSTGTKVDGHVSARTAQNDLVTINIAQSGDNVSEVSVRVGAGNQAVSMEIINRTKGNLHWFGGSSSSDKNGYQLRNMAGTYTALIDASPAKATRAARKSAEQMKLMDIASSHSEVDGKVTARTADDSAVTIDITQAGDNVSKVSIRVGATGDEAISKQLFNGIKSNLSWF